MSDPISILETAYAMASGEEQWLFAIAESMAKSVPGCRGLVGFTYDVRSADECKVRTEITVGFDSGILRQGLEFDRALPKPVRRAVVRVYRTGFIGTTQQAPAALRRAGLETAAVGGFHCALQDFARRLSIADSVWVNAQDPTHLGCLLIAALRTRRRLPPREVHRLHCIAAHVATAFRIRRQLAALAAPAPRCAAPMEAVLRPDGMVEHAEGEARTGVARTALRRAVLSLDRARGALRREDPDEAIAIWRGLVAGRWSLVDRFDSDGRRFVVAHRNAAAVPDARGLTLRERQVLAYAALGHSNKVIGYELGLATSTVAGHLTQARAKLRRLSVDPTK